MSSTLKFSIVTPSFNQGKFIEETIRSVLSQEGDFFIDYIIMDGGSTDNSVEVIKKYDRLLKEGKWPVKCRGIEYRWVSEKDEGQADAIEKGFKRAEGDIGVWLNSDDIFYADNVFEKVSKYFAEEDIDLLIGDGLIIDRAGRKLWVHHTDRIDLKELIFLDYHIMQPAAFLKVSYFKNNPFDRRLNYNFDSEFFIRLLRSGIKYRKVSDIFSCFRMYPEIKTLSGPRERIREYMLIERAVTDKKTLLFISWVYKYFSVIVTTRYANSRLVNIVFYPLRNFFYWLIVGTWGRK